MTLAQTYSWIFYAIALASQSEAAKIKTIEQAADAINHAIPTQKELSASIKWLTDKKMIEKKGKKIKLTDDGSNIIEQASNNPGGLMKVWGRIEKLIEKMGVDNTQQVNPRNLNTEQG